MQRFWIEGEWTGYETKASLMSRTWRERNVEKKIESISVMLLSMLVIIIWSAACISLIFEKKTIMY